MDGKFLNNLKLQELKVMLQVLRIAASACFRKLPATGPDLAGRIFAKLTSSSPEKRVCSLKRVPEQPLQG
jgi:hypothetical protein